LAAAKATFSFSVALAAAAFLALAFLALALAFFALAAACLSAFVVFVGVLSAVAASSAVTLSFSIMALTGLVLSIFFAMA
jgi:hypothetical protein